MRAQTWPGPCFTVFRVAVDRGTEVKADGGGIAAIQRYRSWFFCSTGLHGMLDSSVRTKYIDWQPIHGGA